MATNYLTFLLSGIESISSCLIQWSENRAWGSDLFVVMIRFLCEQGFWVHACKYFLPVPSLKTSSLLPRVTLNLSGTDRNCPQRCEHSNCQNL